MLRRADNVSIRFQKFLFRSKGRAWLRVGRKEYPGGSISQEAYLKEELQQHQNPILMMAIDNRRYWWFQDRFYWENDNLDGEDVHALLQTRNQRERQRIDRARAMVAMGEEPRTRERGHIPDDVKQLVWIRDQGRCRVCGATSELQFDHIISVAMGGSSEVENLQLLCGPCNRRKGAGLTLP
ncbi:HNH endonuclease [Streptomyces rubiginosohelvolus]|uniref:HNH endonuclease n=1 Tax=Streptomyces rubiginosohelvolus TaxID=67362 RepID=UPI0036974B37